MSSGPDKMVIGNQGISTLAWYIEGTVNQIVLDQTELHGKYDIILSSPGKLNNTSKEALSQALLDQLGLELVPARESVEMLVVEKVK